MNIKILSCFHKEFDKPKSNVIYPIQVGKALNASLDLNMIEDSTGDNISSKNSNYCELTATYWAWKNIECDIIGLTHYRRYFDFRDGKYSKFECNIEETDILDNEMFLNYEKSIKDNIKGDKDIILTKQKVFPISIEQQYKIQHIKEDLEILENVLNEKYPQYRNAYMEVMQGNKISPYNMFIMKKTTFNDYCEWLFNILFEVEKKVKISEYAYQARIFGFMSERLLNIYVKYNELNVKYKPVIFINDDYNKKESLLKYKLSEIKKEIRFKIQSI